jgi:hypothetical protein
MFKRQASIPDALQSLTPGAQWVLRGDLYSGLEWLPDNTQTQPTEAEVQAEITRLNAQYPLDECKAEAKKRIAATDWAVLSDVGLQNQAEFVTYRAALRALIVTPVAEPSFPVEPQPVWA